MTDHPEKKVFPIEAVLVYDMDGNYFIHGTNGQTPEKAFKAICSMWDFNPSKETAKVVKMTVWVDDLTMMDSPRIIDANN